MKLRAEALSGALSKALLPVYALCGDEPLLLDEATVQIRAAINRDSPAERQGFVADARFDWRGWMAGFDSLSLFASRRLVELRLPTGKPGVEGGKVLEAWCERPPEEVFLVLLMPRPDRATQQTKWFSAVEGAGASVQITEPTQEQLPAWIGARLARKQLQADRDTLAYLAARVEGNLLAAHQEIEKLALILPPGPVSLADARAAVVDVARYDVNDLSEALLKGDAVRYCRIIDGLQAEGEAPPLAIWLLAQELRTLYRLAAGAASGQALPMLMKQHRVWDSRQALVSQALRQFPVGRLAGALRLASRADRAAKGLLREDAWLMLKQLGLALMGRADLKQLEERYGS
jgi:DNA polymerase-3 subunit delta